MSKASNKLRPLLKDDAYRRVKQMIVEGELEPGAFLSERQLGRELGVSGSPIRAALERLGAEGMVSVSAQRGTIVRDLSFDEIVDQFEFRTVIESHVVKKLAGQLSSGQVVQLKAQLNRQSKAAKAKRTNVLKNVDLDMEFHLLLCGLLGNQEMVAAMQRMRDKMKRAILRVNRDQGERVLKSYKEHKAIVDAVISGDGRLAAKQMADHLRYGRDYLLNAGRDR